MDNRAHDIERYLRGEMTAAEMHALEREALDDPFLAEALEGFHHTKSDTFLADMQALRKSIKSRTKKRRAKMITLWPWSIGIAAAISFIAVVGVYLITSITASKTENQNLASADSTGVKMDSITQESTTTLAFDSLVAETEKDTTTLNPVSDNTRQPLASAAERSSTFRVETEEPRVARTDMHAVTDPTVVIKTFPLKGRIVAEDGSALAGVNIIVKETNRGTISDVHGRYELASVAADQTLVFSSLGFKDMERTTREGADIDVEMRADLSQLSEVVVDGASVDPPAALREMQFAEPEGGREAFEKYLQQKMHYPEVALENKVEGKVTVEFTVSKAGNLTNFKVLNGIGFGCDEEVIRLIKEGPAWRPTRKNDKPVNEKVKVQLKFNLPE